MKCQFVICLIIFDVTLIIKPKMSQKRAILDVDPSIVERNLMITSSQEDDLQSLFPVASDEIPSKLIKPTPGFCVKTRSTENAKIFINVCQTDAIPPPDDISESQLLEILQSETPSEFRVPMSIGEPRPEVDKSGNSATAYDIAINPAFFKKIENTKLFKQFFLTIVFEGIQDKYNVTINTADFTILKNRKAMGNLQMHRIQQREVNKKMGIKEKKLIEEIDEMSTPLATELKKSASKIREIDDTLKEPPYRLSRISTEENNQFYVADFYVPDIISPKDITLDVGEDRIIVESRKRGYLADFFVPQLIQQEKVDAKLNKNNGILTITMPIVRS